MDEILNALRRHMEAVETIGDQIERGEAYMEALRQYLPSLNEMITVIFGLVQSPETSLKLNQEFALQVLNDIIYGIEQEDSVFLLDVLRYGLLEIYDYTAAELQSEGNDE